MTIICPDKDTSTVHFQQPLHILRLSPLCKTMSNYFHLSPHYKDHSMVMNVFLDTANINAINISTVDFRIWQQFRRNWTQPHLQKLTNVPESTSCTAVQRYDQYQQTNSLINHQG